MHAFETARGVRLPESYREFLLRAGHGGAGPYHGLYGLAEWDDFVGWVSDGAPGELLLRPSPLKPGPNSDRGLETEEEILETYAGTISIGHRGCTYMTQLIVTGPHRGRVVYVDANRCSPPYVSREPDFLSWYERWLDELLGGFATGWYGYGPAGDDVALLSILDGSDDDELRVEAACNLIRQPALTPTVALRTASLCADRAAGVREAACGMIQKFELREALDDIARCLRDPVPEVRSAAIRAAMALEPSRFHEHVLQMTWADDEAIVARDAVWALDRFGTFSRSDRVRVLTDSPHGAARAPAAAEGWSCSSTDVELLIRLLDDSHEGVRLSAVWALQELEAHDAVSALVTASRGNRHRISRRPCSEPSEGWATSRRCPCCCDTPKTKTIFFESTR